MVLGLKVFKNFIRELISTLSTYNMLYNTLLQFIFNNNNIYSYGKRINLSHKIYSNFNGIIIFTFFTKF